MLGSGLAAFSNVRVFAAAAAPAFCVSASSVSEPDSDSSYSDSDCKVDRIAPGFVAGRRFEANKLEEDLDAALISAFLLAANSVNKEGFV